MILRWFRLGTSMKLTMHTARIMVGLVVAAFGGCAPHVTIVEGSGGESGLGGSGGTLGGSTSQGGSNTPYPDDCRRVLPELDCDWRSALGAPGVPGFCAKSGCHNTAIAAGQLDLTPDDLLVARLLNVRAAYDITCFDGVACIPGEATCEECATCIPGQVLLSAANPGQGRMFDTLEPFIPGFQTTTLKTGCGDAMPTYNTTGTANYTQAHKDCLIKFFTAIANTPGTWPCVPGARP
jgi:hypothetical protein